MSRFIYPILLFALLASCSGKHEDESTGTAGMAAAENNNNTMGAAGDPGKITDNESKAINAVIAFYNCKCNYAVKNSNAGSTVKKYFVVQVSDSRMLDTMQQLVELSAANIAIIFYSTLHEERKKYDEIRTVITDQFGKRMERSYPVPVLDMVLKKMMIVNKILGVLKEKNYAGLLPLLNDKNGAIEYKKEMLVNQLKEADPSIGNVKDFVPYGFVFFKTDKDISVLHIAGLMIRDKQNNEFSVDIDPKSDKEEAIFINYKL